MPSGGKSSLWTGEKKNHHQNQNRNKIFFGPFYAKMVIYKFELKVSLVDPLQNYV
jgi:hypothetical protein